MWCRISSAKIPVQKFHNLRCSSPELADYIRANLRCPEEIYHILTNTAQHGTALAKPQAQAQHSTARHGTAQHSTAQHLGIREQKRYMYRTHEQQTMDPNLQTTYKLITAQYSTAQHTKISIPNWQCGHTQS